MTSSESSSPQEEEFASLWEAWSSTHGDVSPKRGDIREGTILDVDSVEIIVDIGAKHDAIVSPQEAEGMTPEELGALQVGDAIHVYVLRFDDRIGRLLVSIRFAQGYEDWQRAQQLLDSGEVTKATISGHNRGGLLCHFGTLQGFIPVSQLANLYPRDRSQPDLLAQFVGTERVLKVIEVNRQRRRLVLSERAALRDWRAQQREALLQEIREGQVRRGTVSNLCDFGAFVDLGGMDGLVHLSEVSWARIEHPRDILAVGQAVEVLVLSVDRERERIGLSYKRTQPDPWTSVGEKYAPGQLVRGVVSHLVSFGAFVELEPGIEGLIHLSELAEGDFGDPAGIVSAGEEVAVLVLSVEPEQHRIGLSIRQVPGPAGSLEGVPSISQEKGPGEYRREEDDDRNSRHVEPRLQDSEDE